MSRQPKPAGLDGRLRLEDTQDVPRAKAGGVVSAAEAAGLDQAHNDQRRRDQVMEALPGLTRATRDRDRGYPRPAGAEPAPRKRATFPTGPNRNGPSDYQCAQRSTVKRTAQDRMRNTEYTALRDLVTDQHQWLSLNARLSDTFGAGGQLDDIDRVRVQRVDRAIRRYEETNDRGHLVYSGLTLDEDQLGEDQRSGRGLQEWLEGWTAPGDRFTFDQFTDADHVPHKVGAAPVLLEIETSRGIYLGGATVAGATGHLLPRGIQLEVVAVTSTTVARPGHPPLERPTVQLRVIDDREEPDHGVHRRSRPTRDRAG